MLDLFTLLNDEEDRIAKEQAVDAEVAQNIKDIETAKIQEGSEQLRANIDKPEGWKRFLPPAEAFTPFSEPGKRTQEQIEPIVKNVADYYTDPVAQLGVAGDILMGIPKGVINTLETVTDIVTPSEVKEDSYVYQINEALFGKEAADAKAGETNKLRGEYKEVSGALNKVDKAFPEPTNTLGAVGQGITQFMVPFIPAVKGVEATGIVVKGADKLAKVSPSVAKFFGYTATGTVAGAVGEQFAFDPEDANLFNWVKEQGIEDEFINWLATDPKDSETDNRFKMLIQGVGLGVGVDMLMYAKFRNLKTKITEEKLNENDKAYTASQNGVDIKTDTFTQDMVNKEATFTIDPEADKAMKQEAAEDKFTNNLNTMSDDPLDEMVWEPDPNWIPEGGVTDDIIYGEDGSMVGVKTSFDKQKPLGVDIEDLAGFGDHGTPDTVIIQGQRVPKQDARALINTLDMELNDLEFNKGDRPDLQAQYYAGQTGADGKPNLEEIKTIEDMEKYPNEYPAGKVAPEKYGPLGQAVQSLSERAKAALYKWRQSSNQSGLRSPADALWAGKNINIELPDLNPVLSNIEKVFSNNALGKNVNLDKLRKGEEKEWSALHANLYDIGSDLYSKKKIKEFDEVTKLTDEVAKLRYQVITKEEIAKDLARNGPILKEIYENGQAVRDYLAPYTDEDGFIWLFRGTNSEPGAQSDNTLKSYSLSSKVAYGFGNNVYADKVHLDDIVNMGVAREQELIVRMPAVVDEGKSRTRKRMPQGFDVQTKSGSVSIKLPDSMEGLKKILPEKPAFNPAANDNMAGGGIQADPVVQAQSKKGYLLGRDENDNFLIVSEDGVYSTIPDRPGVKLEMEVQGLVNTERKANTFEYWSNRFRGVENPERMLEITKSPIPAFKRNEDGTYRSEDGRHVIVRESKGWTVYSDSTAGKSTPIDPFKASEGNVDVSAINNDALPGTGLVSETSFVSKTKAKNLNEAIEIAAKFERDELLRTTQPLAKVSKFDDFFKRPGRTYTPEEEDNIGRSKDMFVSTDDAEKLRIADRIAKAGGSVAYYTGRTVDLLRNFKREFFDEGVYLRSLTKDAFGFDGGRPEDLVKVFKAKKGEFYDPDDPFFNTGAFDVIEEPAMNPYSVNARLAGTGTRAQSFLNDTPVGHPGEPIHMVDAEGNVVKQADNRAIKYPKKAVTAYNKTWQKVMDEGDFEEFKAYIAARRAKFLAEERDIPNTIDDYNSIIDNVYKDREKVTKFNGWIDDLQEYYDSVLQYYRDSGMLSKEAYNRIVSKNTPKGANQTLYQPSFYAPVKDGLNDKTTGGIAAGKMKSIVGIAKDRAQQVGLKLLDPWEAGIKYTHSMIRAADLNYAKLVTMRYVEDAIRRGHNAGIEFAPGNSLTQVTAPNWSVKDAVSKQIDAIAGEGSGKEFLKGLYSDIGEELNLSTKEVSGMMDEGYTNLIAFGKGRMIKDKNGNDVYIDMFFDHNRGPRVFKVTDPDAVAYFSNGGKLPTDPNEFEGFWQSAFDWTLAKPARLASTVITHNPAFWVYAFVRDARGRAANSVLMGGPWLRQTRALGNAIKDYTKSFSDRQTLDEIMVAGASFTRHSEVYTMSNSSSNMKRIKGAAKPEDYLNMHGVPENLSDPYLKRVLNKAWKRTAEPGQKFGAWYKEQVFKAEMAGARLSEAVMAKQMGMSDVMQASLAREVSVDLARRGNNEFMQKYMFSTLPFMRSGFNGLYKMDQRIRAGYKGIKGAAKALVKNPNPSIEIDPSLGNLSGTDKAITNNTVTDIGDIREVKRTRLGNARDAMVGSGGDKFLMGIGGMVAGATALEVLKNEYYKEELAKVPDHFRDNFTLIPNVKDIDQAIKDIANGKKPELEEGDEWFPVPKSFDWGIAENLTERAVDAAYAKGSDKLVSSIYRSVANLAPGGGDLIPFTLDPVYDLLNKQDAFGNPLYTEEEFNRVLGEDIKRVDTLTMAIDLSKFINETGRALGKDGESLTTAVGVDLLVKAFTPGLLASFVDAAEYQYKSLNNTPHVIDKRTFKILEGTSNEFMQHQMSGANPLVSIITGVAERAYYSGNQQLNDLYDMKNRMQRIAGSTNLRLKTASEIGGENAFKNAETFINTLKDEKGRATFRGYLGGLSPSLNETVKAVETYGTLARAVPIMDDAQVEIAYNQLIKNDPNAKPEQAQPYMRAYIIDHVTKARDLAVTALMYQLNELPSNEDEFMEKLEKEINPAIPSQNYRDEDSAF